MLLSILIASTKTLSVRPRYSVHFPLFHLPNRGTAATVDRGIASPASVMAVPVSSNQRVPLSITETMYTARELTPTSAERCSTQAMSPAKCVPLELSLSNCNMWPQYRTVAFSLTLWLHVDSEMELTTASDSAHNLGSESTTDADLSPTGAFQLCLCLSRCSLRYFVST